MQQQSTSVAFSSTDYTSPFAYNSFNKDLYVLGVRSISGNGGRNSNSTVLVISPENKIVANLTLTQGFFPDLNNIAFDPANNYIYVTNAYNGTISVLSS